MLVHHCNDAKVLCPNAIAYALDATLPLDFHQTDTWRADESTGVGKWLADAIFNRDYPVLQGGILFVAVIFVIVNLLVDISYALVNPRIRLS